MKSTFLSLWLFVAVAFAQTLTINTPANVVECEPTLLTWSGGTGPYIVSVLPGGQPGSPALQNLGQQTGTSLTWATNIEAGTSVGLTIRDNTGATASSAPFTINSGSSSCLTSSAGSTSAASTSAGSASGASSSTLATTSATIAATTSAAVTPTTTKPTTTATTPAASAASSGTGTKSASGGSATGGASVNSANLGVAGIIGAAVIAILA